MARYCVIGSINMDLIALCDRFPGTGETVFGSQFKTTYGGKGGNQAVALAALEDEVYMVGILGDDMYGRRYLTHFDNMGVETSAVDLLEDESTGIALIEVDTAGKNRIIVVPGGNAHITKERIREHRQLIRGCDYLLFQGEIPFEAIEEGMRQAKEAGAMTVFDPAPVGQFPPELFALVDIITPNTCETYQLTGIEPVDDESVLKASDLLLQMGVGIPILKAGADGAYVREGKSLYQIPALDSAHVVDTTAAGDAFNAGLVHALGQSSSLEDAVRFANVVASMSTERLGAQAAMPALYEALERYRGAFLSKRVIRG